MTSTSNDPPPSTPDREHLRALLSRTELFRAVPREVIDELLPQFQVHEVPAQTVIVEQGQAGNELFVLDSGQVDVTMGVGGHRRTLGRLGPGDFFGEMALLRRSPRTATVTAATPARLWSLSRPALAVAARRAPVLTDTLREVMRRRELANALRALQ